MKCSLKDTSLGGWVTFASPREIISASSIIEVRNAIVRAEHAAVQGHYVIGFVCYEAAPAFDPGMVTHDFTDYPDFTDMPLVLFGVFDQPSPADRPSGSVNVEADWQSNITDEEYCQHLASIDHYLRAGDSYQVNFTYRLRTRLDAAPQAIFKQLVQRQDCRHPLLIEWDDRAVCSVSPELFFQRDAGHLTMRPMKGTRHRATEPDADAALSRELACSQKDRAENLMIVDMVRNDLGRIASPGSVKVADLFAIESYPTVWQMVSTVTAESRASLDEIFGSLFPCASITGAPRIRTMEIIRELESAPRGVYCGALGLLKPGGDARFNVGIRSLVMNVADGVAEYGTGGGILIDSKWQDELAESRTKARVIL